MSPPVNIGISACLVGQAVRYDGAHKRHDLLLAAIDPQVRWIAVCPEVELGLGIPREKIQLEHTGERVRLVTLETRRDITVSMGTWAEKRLNDFAATPLAGYVFKTRSPSCGLTGPQGRGLFAAALVARFGELPVVEETELTDVDACRRFLDRVRSYHAKLAG